MIGDEYKSYTFMQNMNILMNETSDDVDKRQGGLFYDIYTAVANFGALVFNFLRTITLNMHPSTAQGEYLDLHAGDNGLVRFDATNSIRRVYVYDSEGNLIDVDLGTLITPHNNGNLLYSLYEKESVGVYKARCQQVGSKGNEYIGQCDLLDNISNVGTIMMTDIIESARDEENDSALRERIQEAATTKAFGGNIADYRALVGEKLTNISQMQVYPRNFNEPILNSTILSVVDNDNKPLITEALTEIQETLDPSSYPGQGRGLVPIGHHPIVVSPEELEINMSLVIVPQAGYTPEGLATAIEEAIDNYLAEVRDSWADIDYWSENLYEVIIYQSQVIAKVLEVEGVLSVSSLIINEIDGDYQLQENKTKQQIPIKGVVIVS